MNKKHLKYRNEYETIILEINELSNQLTSVHSNHLQCKKGCDLCCMDYSIFPVEFYTILHRLKKKKNISKPAEESNDGACIFLENHSCTIYENRPVICRTHGLPLLYMNENNEWELSNCELNFTDFNYEEFTPEDTIPMDKLNSKLFVLNKKFIASFKENSYKETDLISLKNLRIIYKNNMNSLSLVNLRGKRH